MTNIKKYLPIDIVYLYTNGSDEKFRKIKDKYLKNIETGRYIDDVKDQVYRDNDELKYSLRSIDVNAPWINHIFIVTGFNQKPKWLNIKNPRITVVPQESILPPDAGPIFNSCAIEACIVNIPGLSEHFLMANDDMFFNMPVTPEYFFDKNGKTNFRCIYRRNGRISRDKHSIYFTLLINAAREIEKVFGVNLYNYKSSHGIDPYIKSSVIECLEHKELKKSLDKTKYSRFRSETDIHHLIFNLYDIIKNRTNVIISHSRHVRHNIILDFIYNLIYNKSIKNSVFYCNDAIKSNVLSCDAPIVCVNDSVYNSDITREHNKMFFDKKFPIKSQFEV